VSLSGAVDGVVLGVLSPCDALRARLLRGLGPLVRPLLRDRSLRVACVGVFAVCLALVGTAFAPLMLLALGPLVLGVPHLLADARYMVVRQGLLARPLFLAVVAPCLVLSVLVPGVAWGTCAVAGAALVSRGSRAASLTVFVLVLGSAFVVQKLGARADVWLAHGHNLVALSVWALWSRRPTRSVAPVLLLFALGAIAIFTGALDPWVFKSHALAPSNLTVDVHDAIRTSSPVAEPRLALRFMLFFAFAQSMHYAVWLRMLPEEDRARPAIRSFSASYRAVVADLGAPLLLCGALLALSLIAFACFDLHSARLFYLRLALFHGPLELSVLVLLWLEGARLERAR